jgi:drug/metabolite transporter (DMT)-like permease
VGAGIAENASVFLVLAGLSSGEVSVVTPLAGTAALFVLPLTFVFLGRIEKLTWRLISGVVLIVLGVCFLKR